MQTKFIQTSRIVDFLSKYSTNIVSNFHCLVNCCILTNWTRALYALEAAWSPGFDPATARCRLDIEVPENRALFVALFRHAQVGVRAGHCLC